MKASHQMPLRSPRTYGRQDSAWHVLIYQLLINSFNPLSIVYHLFSRMIISLSWMRFNLGALGSPQPRISVPSQYIFNPSLFFLLSKEDSIKEYLIADSDNIKSSTGDFKDSWIVTNWTKCPPEPTICLACILNLMFVCLALLSFLFWNKFSWSFLLLCLDFRAC